MKQSTRLSSAVFQLTPTRTRCDLIIIAIEKKEKIASGLLNPFLAHLKTAQDQIAKGGYSILLEPEKSSDAAWFTKATLERFVRFVSTPEILERVYTIETEILQIVEAIAVQRSSNMGEITVENHGKRSLGGYKGDRSLSSNDEKAIILYTPGPTVSEADGSGSPEENSRVQLLKVLETRKIVLQKEQGMAFARAVAAGFDIDYMSDLVSFAECFGAMRLMEACRRFINLWKSKHEMGQWLNIEASEALPAHSNFCAANASSIIISDSLSKPDEPNHELASDGKPSRTNNSNNPILNGQQEYIQGQFPHLVFPPWHVQTPPDSHPVFPAYPLPVMPYYQNYTGNVPFFQPHHYPMEHSPPSFSPHSKQEKQSVDVSNSSEMGEVDRTRPLDDMASNAEVTHSRKPNKKNRGSKQSAKVVIRNINYITSKEKISAGEANSDSQSDIDTENEYSDCNDVIHQNKKRFSKHAGNHKLSFNNDEVLSVPGKDTDDRHWLAFQDCLLREGSNEGAHEIQDDKMGDMYKINGSMPHKVRASGDEVMFSSVGNDFRGYNDQTDIQFVENDGRKTLIRTTKEDFASGNQPNRENFRNSLDPLAANIFDSNGNKKDRDYSSHRMGDEGLVVPFRSVDQVGGTDRTAIDIDSEIPAKYQKLGSEGKVNYEPNDLSLMPERRTTGYNNIVLEYEMQVCAVEKGKKNVINVPERLSNNSDKNRRSKVASESSLHKPRTGGLVRKTKPSKMSPLEDARARAESLRSYKADLQKLRKEQEEVQAKRLESLKMERQKRTVARVGSNSVKSSTPSPQTKKLPTKLSPKTNRGSKFSDSEPGSSSSPLQRSKIRISVRSSEPHKAGNRLTRSSSSSLPETRRVNSGVTPDNPKVSNARIRRLSEPKITINSPVTSTRKAESVELKRKLSEGPERNTVSSTNTNHDQSKSATQPELKVKTSKLPHVSTGENVSKVKEDKQKVNRIRTSVFPEVAELNVNNCKTSLQVNSDDNPIVEKTVLLLESEKPSPPTLHGDKVEKSNVTSESDHIHAPPSPMNGICKQAITQNQADHDEVRTVYSEKNPLDPADTTASENLHRAPHARVSSLEDPRTQKTYNDKASLGSSELLPRAEETVKARVPDVKALKLKTVKNKVNSENISIKESSKGFRRLLMFGKKSHTSSSVDQIIDSEESTGGNSIKHKDNGLKMAPTGEVDTLKNLISQDETSAPGNAPQKSSRQFSLFSHFRKKNK